VPELDDMASLTLRERFEKLGQFGRFDGGLYRMCQMA
jgi:hypothetical protein